MLKNSEYQLQKLNGLSVKAFTESLLNEYYPNIYSTLNIIDEKIQALKVDYTIDLLLMTFRKLYQEFDELHRKEKLVLFPYINKLSLENKKSESCSPFKNTKQHHKAMLHLLDQCNSELKDFFINTLNEQVIDELQNYFHQLKRDFIALQTIKDSEVYKQLKTCNGCNTIKPTP